MCRTSALISRNVLTIKNIREAKKVALYYADENEVQTSFLMQPLFGMGVELYFPVINHDSLLFYSYRENEKMEEAVFGIMQPPIKNKEPIDYSELDVICLPLVAFDKQCIRIGRGGGYYDRALASIKSKRCSKPFLLGLAYEFQQVEEIPAELWDIPLEAVSTEKTIYYRDES